MAEQVTTGGKRNEQEITCVRCGLVQTEMWEDKGKGYYKNGKLYCCQDCAENRGCTCIVPGGGG